MPGSKETYKFILIGIDVCSRFILLAPLAEKSAILVAKQLFEWFMVIGPPRILQSDNGSEFSNALLHHLMTLLSASFRHSTPYYPQGNGLVERAVRSTLELLRKELSELSGDWVTLLPATQFKLNQRLVSTHKSLPFEVMFARKANLFKDSIEPQPVMSEEELDRHLKLASEVIYPAIFENVQSIHQQRNKNWNLNHSNLVQFKPDQSVMVKNQHPVHKFSVRFFGPYKVVRQKASGTYVLSDASGSPLPRSFAASMLKLVQSTPATDLYFVEEIVDHKTENEEMLFKVRWFGYPPECDSWEPRSAFSDPHVVDNYLNRFIPSGRETC
jgi:hypothetical protein